MWYFIATLILFSSMEVVSKPLMSFIDPFVLTMWRFVLGTIFLIAYSLYKKQLTILSHLKKREYALVILLGFLNTFFSMSMLQLAVKYSGAATSALIFCSNPIFVFIIAITLKEEVFNLNKFVGIILGIIGITLVSAQKGFTISYGLLYALLASVSFALYTVLNKKALKFLSPLPLNVGSFLSGLLFFGLYLIIAEKDFLPSTTIKGEHIITILYLGIGITGIGYITFIETIKRFSPISASFIFLLKPIIASLLSLIFLSENLSLTFFIGMGLVLIGTMIIIYEKIRRRGLTTST